MSFQELTLLGNLSRDPELVTTKGGTVLCRFSVPHNYKRGEDENVTWFNCVAFGKSAEFVNQYFKKGKPILVKGRVELHTWEANDGGQKTDLQVVVDRVSFVPSDFSEKDEGQREEPSQTERGRQRQEPAAKKSSDSPW
jgi:single-strand DNA-binding protein